MASILHTCLLLLLLIIVQGQGPVCGPNERYNDCGSSCIETCDYKRSICNRKCNPGCFCVEGYVRQSGEKGSPCIKREACKKKGDTPITNQTKCVYPRTDILLDIDAFRSFVADIGNDIIYACGGGNRCSRYLNVNELDAVIDDIAIVYNELGMFRRDIYDCTK